MDWDFQDLETQEGGKYATCLVPVKHTGSAWSLTNGKGQFPETLPDLLKLRNATKIFDILKYLHLWKVVYEGNKPYYISGKDIVSIS